MRLMLTALCNMHGEKDSHESRRPPQSSQHSLQYTLNCIAAHSDERARCVNASRLHSFCIFSSQACIKCVLA